MKNNFRFCLLLSSLSLVIACGETGENVDPDNSGGSMSTGGSMSSGGMNAGGSSDSSGGGPDGGDQDCAAWDLEYDIEGDFEIAGTTGGLGDTNKTVGPGSLSVRVPNQDGAPAEGSSVIMSYSLPQMFEVSGVITDVVASVDGGECGTGEGSLSITGETATLEFSSCATERAPADENDNEWGPADAQSTEPGCWQNYKSQGEVDCQGGALVCRFGNLDEGINEQDEIWSQAMNSLNFAEDFSSLTMEKAPVPNAQPSSTYLGLTGTLKMRTCVAEVPNCSP
ncbi:MAG: hypothetical protein MK135_16345 [Polyangiaceae bacterium]|nr:hypothetical protein [Polyangiaceae bacterium]